VIYLEDNYEARYANYDINSPESVIGLTIMQEEFLDQSILLAKLIQDNFTAKLNRNDRKVKQAGFIVLHQTFMPSVLIETGFLTNKEEGKYLNSAKGQTEMGKAIAEAILKYKGSIPDSETVISNGGVQKPTTPVRDVPKKPEPEVKKEEIQSKAEEKGSDIRQPDIPVSQNTTPEKTAETTAPAKEIREEKARMLVSRGADIVFKVQIMATAKNLPLNAPEFKGLNKISREPINNLIRYLYGETDTYMGAKLLKANADMKGFTTSYIVAYKAGKRIPLQDALKYEDE
jgi:N-acetylmuramoyl-L-alanine amidase